ncbi:uncharacterized protein LOC141866356 [Acropora palmata]|uniref:uncharacterized protein LOC141866356 n=1 Tax=Acropora palmata TaxID=6131 RepID=UPI003DA18F70
MDIQKGTYTYTGYNDQKHKVPIERVNSCSQVHKGDHIAFQRYNGLYSHHAVVEDVETENDTIKVIEYTPRGYSQDNSSPPKNPGTAKVKRGKYSASKDGMYLIKHDDRCLAAGVVVKRAQSRLGENKYGLLENNCEHFVMSCKTGISTSEQVKNMGKMVKEIAKEIEDLVKCYKTGVEEMVTTTVREMTEEVVTQTVSRGEQVIMKKSAQTVAERVVTETMSNGGQQILKIGTETTAIQIVSETMSNGGTQILKISTETAGEQLLGQTVLNGGQQVLTSGTRETTKEFFSHTAKKAGEEIVTKGTRETTSEVITETSKTTGNSAGESLVGVAALAVFIETASAAYDIYCTNEDLKAGKISEEEYKNAVGKRIAGGIGSVAFSTTGAVIGQLLIPVPVVGGFVGSLAGGMVGRFSGGALWDVAK